MSDQFDLYEYLRPLLRWWWLLVAATLVAVLASFIYVTSQPPLYMARATLMVGSSTQDRNPSGGEFYLTNQLAETYADIANRAPVRIAAMEALGMEWLPYFTVSHVPNRPMIQLSVYDEDPDRAFVVAEELVRQIILLGPEEEQARQDFVDQQLAKLQASITETEQAIIDRENELLTIDSARGLADKQVEIRALQEKLTTMQRNYADLMATTQRGAVNAVRVLEPVARPNEPISSELAKNLAVAAVLGFVLAAGGAYLLEFVDKTFRDAEQLKEVLAVPLLGSVPAMSTTKEGGEDKLIMMHNDPTTAVEAYRMVRTNLQFSAVDHSLRLLLITSAEVKDGKSLTAANLSIALASAGKKVVLMDADLHRPAQQRLFKLYNHMGVTTALLAGDANLDQLLQPTIVPGLSVLTSGPLPPNPAELLGTRRMNDLLAKLQEIADIVVIDSPPLTAVVDSLILGTQVDGILLVVRAQKTRRDLAKRALDALRQVQTRVIGAVFNGVPTPQIDFYNRKYGYYQTAYGQRARQGTTNRRAGAGMPDVILSADYDLVDRSAASAGTGDWVASKVTPEQPAGNGTPSTGVETPDKETGSHPNANGVVRPLIRRRTGFPYK